MVPRILYEDNHLLVAIKPPGVLSQAGELALPDMLTLLKEYLKVTYAKPGNVFLGLVHRLDTNVGGVMVFAKTSKAASRLSASIRERAFAKRYVAIVDRCLPVGEVNTLEDVMGKDETNRSGEIVEDAESGKLAKLTYRVWANHPTTGQSLLDVDLESGRFHQIRLQLASRGMALSNDRKYGDAQKGLDRQIGLWAYSLAFPHPTTQALLCFQSFPEGALFHPFQKDLQTHIDSAIPYEKEVH
jgi:23S rRNA pseudouridine1911/1915/1917 synthase